MPSRELPLFEIVPSPIAGRGAFALQVIPAHTRLIEYTGERVTHEVADARYDAEEAKGNTHTVLFALDDKIVIDAGVGVKAPYFHRSWVNLPWSTSKDELRYRLTTSYALVRSSLTKKAQTALDPF